LTISFRTEPTFTFGENTACVEVLEILEEINRVHPEYTIKIIHVSIGFVIKAGLSSIIPLARIICPVSIPLLSFSRRTMRVSELQKKFIVVLFNL